jgi:hypothetical protein
MGSGPSKEPKQLIQESKDLVKESGELVKEIQKLFDQSKKESDETLKKFGEYTLIFNKTHCSFLKMEKDAASTITGFINKALKDFLKQPTENITNITKDNFGKLINNQISRGANMLLSTFEAVSSGIGKSDKLQYKSDFEVKYLEQSYYCANVAFMYGISKNSWFSSSEVTFIGFQTIIVSTNKPLQDLMKSIYLLGSIDRVQQLTREISNFQGKLSILEEKMIEEEDEDKIKGMENRCKIIQAAITKRKEEIQDLIK